VTNIAGKAPIPKKILEKKGTNSQLDFFEMLEERQQTEEKPIDKKSIVNLKKKVQELVKLKATRKKIYDQLITNLDFSYQKRFDGEINTGITTLYYLLKMGNFSEVEHSEILSKLNGLEGNLKNLEHLKLKGRGHTETVSNYQNDILETERDILKYKQESILGLIGLYIQKYPTTFELKINQGLQISDQIVNKVTDKIQEYYTDYNSKKLKKESTLNSHGEETTQTMILLAETKNLRWKNEVLQNLFLTNHFEKKTENIVSGFSDIMVLIKKGYNGRREQRNIKALNKIYSSLVSNYNKINSQKPLLIKMNALIDFVEDMGEFRKFGRMYYSKSETIKVAIDRVFEPYLEKR